MCPGGIDKFGDFIPSKVPGRTSMQREQKDRLSTSPATVLQFIGRFEEEEMPSLSPVIASSGGMYYCPYEERKSSKAYRLKCLLRYIQGPTILQLL